MLGQKVYCHFVRKCEVGLMALPPGQASQWKHQGVAKAIILTSDGSIAQQPHFYINTSSNGRVSTFFTLIHFVEVEERERERAGPREPQTNCLPIGG